MEQEKLDALHRAYLQMIRDFDAFCEENGIAYSLIGGTLLGAARHKGFIPWDDDADLCMDVKNYRRLLKLRDRLPAQFFLQNFRTEPKVGSKWSTLRLNGTTAMSKDLTHYDVHMGVGIDIFPIYGMAGTKLGRAVQRMADNAMNTLLYKDWAEAWGKPVSGRMKVLYALLPGKLRIWTLSLLEHIQLLDTQHGDQATSLFYNLRNGCKTLPAEYFRPDDRAKMPFEDAEFWAPRRYEDILTLVYGDWKTPVPYPAHADYILDLEHDYKTYYEGD